MPIRKTNGMMHVLATPCRAPGFGQRPARGQAPAWYPRVAFVVTIEIVNGRPRGIRQRQAPPVLGPAMTLQVRANSSGRRAA
jgi:hypothetical protein